MNELAKRNCLDGDISEEVEAAQQTSWTRKDTSKFIPKGNQSTSCWPDSFPEDCMQLAGEHGLFSPARDARRHSPPHSTCLWDNWGTPGLHQGSCWTFHTMHNKALRSSIFLSYIFLNKAQLHDLSQGYVNTQLLLNSLLLPWLWLNNHFQDFLLLLKGRKLLNLQLLDICPKTKSSETFTEYLNTLFSKALKISSFFIRFSKARQIHILIKSLGMLWPNKPLQFSIYWACIRHPARVRGQKHEKGSCLQGAHSLLK